MFQGRGHLTVNIDAPFHGDPPPDHEPGRAWKLWEHEVVELFLVGDDGHYLEAEFGPHGHWLILSLDGIRSIANSGIKPKSYECTIRDNRWTASAVLSRNVLPRPITRMNAFAIHGVGSERRYLSYGPLPGDSPDFHQPLHFPTWPK